MQDRCPEFLSTGKVKPQTELRTYGTIYANKENGKLEANKEIWLHEKIYIRILGNRVSSLFKGGLRASNETDKKYIAVDYDYFCFCHAS